MGEKSWDIQYQNWMDENLKCCKTPGDDDYEEFKLSSGIKGYLKNAEIVFNRMEQKAIRFQFENMECKYGVISQSKMETYVKNKTYVENIMKKKKEAKKVIYKITINPDPKKCKDWKILFNEIIDFQNYVWVHECYWCIEQRGETLSEIGQGFHAHILLTMYNCKWSLMIKNLNRKFGNICSKTLSDKNQMNYERTINVSNVEVDGNREQRITEEINDYLLGKNKHIDKDAKCSFDELWRTDNGINSLYYKGKLGQCCAQFTEATLGIKLPLNFGRGARGVKMGTKRGKYNCKNKIDNLDMEKKITNIDF